jgi:excisionase family DNA binding protein
MNKLLSIDEAAEILGISKRTLYNGVARRSKRPFPVRPVHIGRLVKFDVADLERFVELQKIQARTT